MKLERKTQDDQSVLLVESEKLLFLDVDSAVDFVMSLSYEHDCRRIALNKEAIVEDFFILSTRLAGEILQKFINYHIKFAVYGDFSKYTSKPLKDFIYESNHGNDFFFVDDPDTALACLFAAQ